jgi:hypothetical protein
MVVHHGIAISDRPNSGNSWASIFPDLTVDADTWSNANARLSKTGSLRRSKRGRRSDVDVLTARPSYVIGPDGEALTMETLPAAATQRWVVRRKAQVVAAVHGGLLTPDKACSRYGISLDELSGWQRAIQRSGLPGLRVTRAQSYRALYAREQRFI